MPSTLGAQLRSLWHDLTSNDRHASVDSPFRTGSHQSLPQTRHAPLTSVATTALDSRTDLDSSYKEDGSARHGSVSYNGTYTPGLRSTLRRQSSGFEAKTAEQSNSSEIQLQSFSDGLPPPPPVWHSWKRIDHWLEDNYEELSENLCEGATMNDVNELEHQLDCTLPPEVRDSLQIHDGQERGGLPTGVIFGCMLLDCEEIMQEWSQWRTINEVYFGESKIHESPQVPSKALAGSSSQAQPVAQAQQSGNPQWRQELLDRQDSQPTNAIQKAYAHPYWIPLARDWGGNNICVDLAPGPAGRWGQVILTGRDYDCKYVVSRSWAAFLATLGDDMNTDKWFIDEDSKELKLREFKQQGVEPAYIDILRWRSDQKYGRKLPKRPMKINPGGAGSGRGSPYNSPTEDRGRSPQRFSQNGKQPVTGSPRGHLSSPLARVAEESLQPLKLDTTHVDLKPEKLVSADTPRPLNSNSAVATKVEKLVPVDTPVSINGSGNVIGIGENGPEDRRASFPRSKLNNSILSPVADEDISIPTSAEQSATSAGAEDTAELKNVEF